jgi:hypothetical protein
VPGPHRGESFENLKPLCIYIYREKITGFEMQKQRRHEVVRRINDWKNVAEIPMKWHERIHASDRKNQWIDESTKQGINESMNRWINEWRKQRSNEWMNQWLTEDMILWMNESTKPWISEPMKHRANQRFNANNDLTHQRVSESMSQWISMMQLFDE